MRVGVVYESLFGDTREIAEAIAAGIREADPAADLICSPAAQADLHLAQADLLIVGAPTHFLGLPSRRSRMMQLRYRNDSGTWYITGPVPRLAGNIAGSRPRPAGRAAGSQPPQGAPAGVREWLERLPQAAGGACAAAFDTRLDKLMSGSAAREIGHSLRNRGYQLVARPEGFSVADFEGPLAEGERERARQWGVEAYRAVLQQKARPPGRPLRRANLDPASERLHWTGFPAIVLATIQTPPSAARIIALTPWPPVTWPMFPRPKPGTVSGNQSSSGGVAMSETRTTDFTVTETEEAFTSGGVRCAATVYRPHGVTGPTPVVVMAHGLTLTRRDGIPAFARRFAATGYSVMAFDYRHWGDSDGHPRGWFSFGRQQCDWRAAVAFARQLDGIDPDRLVLWGFSMGGGMALKTAAADPRVAAVIAVCPGIDGLAAWLEPAPVGMVLRMVSRALRETITRRPVAMPVAGKPGDFAVTTAPEALPGFERVTAGRPWRNEISTSWLFALAAFRPITAVPRIATPVLYQIAQHDGMPTTGEVDKATARTPRAEVQRYPMDHFGPFSPEHQPTVAADASDFLRTRLAT